MASVLEREGHNKTVMRRIVDQLKEFEGCGVSHGEYGGTSSRSLRGRHVCVGGAAQGIRVVGCLCMWRGG